MQTTIFCPCRRTQCPQHPTNHTLGCSPCVANNLAKGEIPCCFFAQAIGNPEGHGDLTVEGFIKAVEELSCEDAIEALEQTEHGKL